MTTQQEKLFLIIWKANSATPGLIETIKYKESELAVHNKDEVLGPFREYVELIPGSNLDRLMYNAGDITEDDPLFDVNIGACTWNWETNDLNLVYKPELNWDDIRAQRNVMLAAGDNMFNFDTPDPLKTDWVEHRALLRDLINREQAAGRTPKTVFWHDYVPPMPLSARNGVPDDIKPQCVWYVEGKYSSPAEPPAEPTGE